MTLQVKNGSNQFPEKQQRSLACERTFFPLPECQTQRKVNKGERRERKRTNRQRNTRNYRYLGSRQGMREGVEPGEWGNKWGGGLLKDREGRGRGLISIRQTANKGGQGTRSRKNKKERFWVEGREKR